MHLPKMIKVIHKQFGQLYTLVEEKDDSVNLAEGNISRIEKAWFLRTKKNMEPNQNFPY